MLPKTPLLENNATVSQESSALIKTTKNPDPVNILKNYKNKMDGALGAAILLTLVKAVLISIRNLKSITDEHEAIDTSLTIISSLTLLDTVFCIYNLYRINSAQQSLKKIEGSSAELVNMDFEQKLPVKADKTSIDKSTANLNLIDRTKLTLFDSLQKRTNKMYVYLGLAAFLMTAITALNIAHNTDHDSHKQHKFGNAFFITTAVLFLLDMGFCWYNMKKMNSIQQKLINLDSIKPAERLSIVS